MTDNLPCLTIRNTVTFLNTPRLPDRGPGEQMLIDALELIDLAREALDFNASPAVAHAKRLAFLRRTDPVVQAVVLGGVGAPPASQPLPGDAP